MRPQRKSTLQVLAETTVPLRTSSSNKVYQHEDELLESAEGGILIPCTVTQQNSFENKALLFNPCISIQSLESFDRAIIVNYMLRANWKAFRPL
jgi:hypothetical protein